MSRLDPETSVADVAVFAEPFLEGNQITCLKLKTRFDTYSSFHISLECGLFDLINQSNVWPEGFIFREFLRRMDE